MSKRTTIAGKIPVVGVVPSPVMQNWKGDTIAISLEREAVPALMAACDAALRGDAETVTLTVFRREQPLRLTVTAP